MFGWEAKWEEEVKRNGRGCWSIGAGDGPGKAGGGEKCGEGEYRKGEVLKC